MLFYLDFAWRNLWRNKRRTLLASSSIFFAVLLALFMRSMQLGTYTYMIQNTVSLYTGYLQLQGKNYWDERSFDESIPVNDSLLQAIAALPHVTHVNPRLETVALISYGLDTRVSPVTGIVPRKEDEMSNLASRVIRGSYLTDSSHGVLLAEGLAERLHVALGDSVILFGQGYEGVTAAEQLKVEGILHYPLPQLNNAMVILALPKAQELFNAYGRVTSVAMMIDDADNLSSVQQTLNGRIDSSMTTMTWQEMMPEVVQTIKADNGAGIVMLLILYIVISFGVFGTIMMMTIERSREFGLLIALGMKRRSLATVSCIEAVFVSMVGALAGMVGAFPIVLYFHDNPIRLWGDTAQAMLSWGIEPLLPLSLDPGIFVAQTFAVFLIAFVTTLYPVLVIRKIRPVAALRGQGAVRR